MQAALLCEGAVPVVRTFVDHLVCVCREASRWKIAMRMYLLSECAAGEARPSKLASCLSPSMFSALINVEPLVGLSRAIAHFVRKG